MLAEGRSAKWDIKNEHKLLEFVERSGKKDEYLVYPYLSVFLFYLKRVINILVLVVSNSGFFQSLLHYFYTKLKNKQTKNNHLQKSTATSTI